MYTMVPAQVANFTAVFYEASGSKTNRKNNFFIAILVKNQVRGLLSACCINDQK